MIMAKYQYTSRNLEWNYLGSSNDMTRWVRFDLASQTTGGSYVERQSFSNSSTVGTHSYSNF